mgnify:CR=1 FL=1
MSWEDILKREMVAQTMLEKPKQEEAIDFADSEDFCCGKAKNQILEILTIRVERLKREGRDATSASRDIDVLDTLDCGTLKAFLRKEVAKTQPVPKGKRINPELLAFKEILEEWDDCEDNR